MQTCWAYTTLLNVWNCSGINNSLVTEILCFVHKLFGTNLINNVQKVDLYLRSNILQNSLSCQFMQDLLSLPLALPW